MQAGWRRRKNKKQPKCFCWQKIRFVTVRTGRLHYCTVQKLQAHRRTVRGTGKPGIQKRTQYPYPQKAYHHHHVQCPLHILFTVSSNHLLRRNVNVRLGLQNVESEKGWERLGFLFEIEIIRSQNHHRMLLDY
jgi:hypothetical protein